MRKETLIKYFDQLDEENQLILIAECHDLLHVQQLKEKHSAYLAQVITFKNCNRGKPEKD